MSFLNQTTQIRPICSTEDPKDRTHSSIQKEIHNIETLLKEAGKLQDKAKKCKHTQRITELIKEASTSLLTIWDDPSTCANTTEHNALWASIEKAKTNNTSLFIQSLELDQDTEGIGTGDEATKDNASDLSNNMEYTATVEVLQTTQQKVQDDTRHQHFSQGKLSALGTMDAAYYSPRPALALSETPQLSPPQAANPEDTERVVTKSTHTSKTHQELENKIGSQGLPPNGDISPETDIKRSNDQIFNKVSITELPDNMEHATDPSDSNNDVLLHQNQTSQTKTTNMSELLDLGEAVSSRIRDMKQCLTDITLPVQMHIHVKNIKRIQELTSQANTDIKDIESYHEEGMGSSQNRDISMDTSIRTLGNFKTSIHDIKRGVSAICSGLCTGETPHNKTPAEASKKCTIAVETKHIDLAQGLELNQDGDSSYKRQDY